MDICRQNGTADPYGHTGEAVEVSMDNKVERKHKEEESEEVHVTYDVIFYVVCTACVSI